MNDSNAHNLAAHLLKNNCSIRSQSTTPEMLSQHLLCMNNLFGTMTNQSVQQSTTPPNMSPFTKEQLAEYQLAKMRYNQETLGTGPFYNSNFPYNYPSYTMNVPKSSSPITGNYGNGGGGGGRSVEPSRYSRFLHEDPKPQHSYIGLIAIAILSMPDQKMVLSDIYQYILDNYPYFRNRGPGWRNSIRHNLSLNDCFVKAGRSANGKGHYWAIHPANLDDFKKGDFRRRKAQRKVRRHMGLSVPDDDDDDDESPIPSPNPAAVMVDKSTVGPIAAGLLGPNPFLTAMSNPLFGVTNPCFSPQAAFNFFNTLRFATLPPPASFNAATATANFNETLYRQLINLNIKQDLQTNSKQTNNNNTNRNQFSIESLLSMESRSHNDSDVDSESDKNTTQMNMDEDRSDCSGECMPTQTDLLLLQTDGTKSQPVNLKIN
ncbi:hypothetical protein RDWZM_005898 [Blomia tropicalis]|uniref:Fork-head domain-containing protein n=1 Tax=Blomia tropicalis TaxID=40697 RepID=A0A9Q0RMU9_BLOTA|nr:hypothetical protein RDWZM_005898 [Blomia tropicalis]